MARISCSVYCRSEDGSLVMKRSPYCSLRNGESIGFGFPRIAEGQSNTSWSEHTYVKRPLASSRRLTEATLRGGKRNRGNLSCFQCFLVRIILGHCPLIA